MTTTIRMQHTGAPSVLHVEDIAAGEPGPGQVRLRQEAIGVNYVDTMVRDGRFPLPLPAVPGFEGAGTVEALGPGVTHLRVGQRVGYFFAIGAYAAERVIDAHALVPLPDDVDAKRAAAFLSKGLTAWMGLRALYRLRAGETILVQGASGNVGAILARWARSLGATVIGVAGGSSKLDKVKGGANHALAADDPAFADKLRAIAPAGLDVVYDFVGAAVAPQTLAALRDGGVIVAIGAASGPAHFDPATLARRGIRVLAGGTPQYVKSDTVDGAVGELFGAMRAGLFGDLAIVPYPLARAAEAHEDIDGRRLDGIAVLVP
jgi:NADPH2:quinone reductase